MQINGKILYRIVADSEDNEICFICDCIVEILISFAVINNGNCSMIYIYKRKPLA